MRKLISAFLCLMFVFASFSLSAFAVETVTVDIYDESDLFDFATAVNNDEFKDKPIVVNICADIQLTSSWVPADVFWSHNVTIEGGNHTISGFDNVFLESADSVTINNLTVQGEINLIGVETTNDRDVSFLVGVGNHVVINNVKAQGTINSRGYKFISEFGGMVGEAWELIVSDSSSEVDINISQCQQIWSVGGIAGYVAGKGRFSNTFYKGSITASDLSNYCESVGGIVGVTEGDAESEGVVFENCCVESNMVFSSVDNSDYEMNYVGGLIGRSTDIDVTVNNCYADVNIEGDNLLQIGGIVGGLQSPFGIYNSYSKGELYGNLAVGGIAGIVVYPQGEFVNCYSICDITGADMLGGFAGFDVEGAYYANCYATGSVTSEINSEGVGIFMGVAQNQPTFIQVYSALNSKWGPLGQNGDSSDIILVDFSDDIDVDNMTGSLNTYVEAENSSDLYEVALLFWIGKNEKNGPAFTETVQYLVGDVNFDGKLTATDYLMLKKVIFGTLKIDDLGDPETAVLRCDVTGDGEIKAADYFKLKRLIFQ